MTRKCKVKQKKQKTKYVSQEKDTEEAYFHNICNGEIAN